MIWRVVSYLLLVYFDILLAYYSKVGTEYCWRVYASIFNNYRVFALSNKKW